MEKSRKVRVIPVLARREELILCLREQLPHIEFKELHPGCAIILIKILDIETKIKGVRLVYFFFSSAENEDDLNTLKESEIIISDPYRICPFLHELTAARWIQGTWAGADVYKKYINKNKPKLPFILTRFSGPSFGLLMGEYVVGQIIIYERDFFKIHQNQSKKLWSWEGKIFNHRMLADLTIGVLGFGALGKEISHLLKIFKAKVWVLVRAIPSEEERQPYVDEYRTVDELPELLSSCDYVCNILPSTDDTKGLLGNGILKHCYGKGTVFMNIGRGSIISEKDLVEALTEKWIAGAILDVFEGEPLAPSSPLWSIPQVTVTPHVSGVVRPQDVAKLFAKNLELFESGQPLQYVYDVERGY